jgi:hypothetical protein
MKSKLYHTNLKVAQKLIYFKNCVCVEQNLSCTSICGCYGNEECRNQPAVVKEMKNVYNGKKYTMPFTEVSC